MPPALTPCPASHLSIFGSSAPRLDRSLQEVAEIGHPNETRCFGLPPWLGVSSDF